MVAAVRVPIVGATAYLMNRSVLKTGAKIAHEGLSLSGVQLACPRPVQPSDHAGSAATAQAHATELNKTERG